MTSIVKKYASAIVSGNIAEIAVTLSAAVRVMPPGANQANEGVPKASAMLSAVAGVVADFKCIHVYESGDGWSAVALEGMIDQTSVQFMDQIHLDDSGLVDHIDIFLRPATMAPSLLAKVSTAMQARSAK